MSIMDVPYGIAAGKVIEGAGQTGAKTINSQAGQVRFASGATSLVVTNNMVTTISVIELQIASNDASCNYVTCTTANGSFTINAPTAPAAEMPVNFTVTN